MSSNGIAASSGDLSESSNQGQPGNCSQCGKDIPCTKSAVAWETMVYCDENCLGKYQDKMNNCSTCKVHVQTAFLGKYIHHTTGSLITNCIFELSVTDSNMQVRFCLKVVSNPAVATITDSSSTSD